MTAARSQGRDPATGNTLWSYARDLELCGVTYVYNYAVAVYPDVRGCGQVSTVDAKTGVRGPSRTSYADPEVRLSADGTTVLSAGDSRLEMWRSDMVRMLSYGSLDAKIKPGTPASPVCRLVSAQASSTAVSVLEACPKQADLRLTLLRPADEEDTPNTKYVPQPGVVDDSGARVIAVSDTTTAVYVPTPKPTVNIVDETGATVASSLVPKPPSPNATMSRAGDLITWWTGDSVMVFSANGLRYRYTVTASGSNIPLGPATMMAGRLLVPVTGGYDVFDPTTGDGIEHIPVQRPPSYRGGGSCGGGFDDSRAARQRTRRAGLEPILSDWARWVFVSTITGADADRSLLRALRWCRPWHRPRPGSHVLRPPEPPSHHRGDRRRHERPDDQRVEQQADSDRGAHLSSDDEVADHHRHHGEREHQTGRRHHGSGARHRPDDAGLDARRGSPL